MTITLPIHPRTGLQALGVRRDGRPIWPVAGGSEPAAPTAPPTPDSAGATPPAPADAPTPPANGTPPDTGDEPLREPGKRALQQERDRANALEKQLGELAGMDLGALKKVAEALGGKPTGDGKTDLQRLTERLASHENDLATEREARWRAEVANDKRLNSEQAAELRGSTKDELAAHADRLLSLFPTSPPAPGTPKPDPSQGAKGPASAPGIDDQINDAQSKGDWRTVLRLQNQKLTDAAKTANK